MDVRYSNQAISVELFRKVLIDSGLSKRRPVNDLNRMQKMVDHGDVMISAWVEDEIVGVARTISDFSFCSYLSDLAVHKDYQKIGIGRELIERTRAIIGKDVMLLLIAAPAAKEYYAKVGFIKMDRAWIYLPTDP